MLAAHNVAALCGGPSRRAPGKNQCRTAKRLGVSGQTRAICTTSWPSGGKRVICPLPVVSYASTMLIFVSETKPEKYE